MSNIEAMLRESLIYNPDTGIFIWKPRPRDHFKNAGAYKTWNKRWAGKEAGWIGGMGYSYISIDSATYRAHRVAWLLVTGEWPSGGMDHKNRCRSDNRWHNLRLATLAENVIKSKVRSDNTSGLAGVSWSEERQKWCAYITVGGRTKSLGRFEDFFEACCVRKSAEFTYYPDIRIGGKNA